MHDAPKQQTEIVTYKIPRIEIYWVTDEELCRVEESCGKVSQDFTFASNFLSVGIAFFIALKTASFSITIWTIFVFVVIACGIGFLYTGLRWLVCRQTVPSVLAKIRSRKTDEPQTIPDENATP